MPVGQYLQQNTTYLLAFSQNLLGKITRLCSCMTYLACSW